MLLTRRNHGSRRTSEPQRLTIDPSNTVGDGGVPYITLEGSDAKGRYYLFLLPETPDESHLLLSAAHKAFGNLADRTERAAAILTLMGAHK